MDYNLIDEPWIRVIDARSTVHEVSLKEALLGAHLYTGLKGELPTQDVAVMRLMLAVMYRIFLRVGPDGKEDPVTDQEGAFARWKALWDCGKLPEGPVSGYLDKWHDRFWLFHETRPFYQAPKARRLKEPCRGRKLNGAIAESGNKTRLFAERTGESMDALTYPEAARWLVNLIAFDDTSGKAPRGQGLPSPGAGWLGRLGLVFAEGNSLFETLMLNFPLLKNAEEVWGDGIPTWEPDEAKSEERTKIDAPKTPAELLTLQSRRVLLFNEGGTVNKYNAVGGDYFDSANVEAEQMTVWNTKKEKDGSVEYTPRRHNPSRQLWRMLPELFWGKGDGQMPGVAIWSSALAERGLHPLAGGNVRYSIASVQYHSKDNAVDDIYGDSIEFPGNFLKPENRDWVDMAEEELKKCEKAALCLRFLDESLLKAAGVRPASARDKAQANLQFYDRIEAPFRRWLRSLGPGSSASGAGDIHEKEMEWENEVVKTTIDIGEEAIERTGMPAFTGRMIKDDGYYALSDSWRHFLFSIRAIFPWFKVEAPALPESDKKDEIKRLVRMKVYSILEAPKDDPETALELAWLRRGAGRMPEDVPDLWKTVSEGLPEGFPRGSKGSASPEEWAYFTAVALFALHQEGHDRKDQSMYKGGTSFGTAACILSTDKKSGERDPLARERFNRLADLAVSPCTRDLSRALKNYVLLLKDQSVPVDYGMLAEDIYCSRSLETTRDVLFRWGWDFYDRIQAGS